MLGSFDIMFRACGENSSIINTSSSGNTLTICQNSNITNPNLEVVTSGSISHVYQWQQSNDNINFTDISGENSANFTIPNITSTTYYRVKVAQDITNLNNPFCSTFSDIYSVVIIPSPNAPTSNGDQRICSNQATNLSVSVMGGETVNWYDSPTNGNLLLANSTTYTPTNVGTYYAETVSLLNGCKSNTRTAVTLLPAISVTSSGPTTLCTNTNTAITLVASDVNATLNWTATSTDVTGFSNGSGTSINQTLQYNGTTSGTVTYVVNPILNGCEGNPETIVVTVTPATTINLVFPPITTTYCLNATPEILPTLSSNTTPITGTWSPSVINTSSVGTTTYTFTPQVGSCQNILPYQINITVGNNLSPDFPSTISLCSGEIAPILTNISPNGISGTWSPAVINNLVSGSYTFTPNLGSCTIPQTINVTIIESQLESFSYSISGAFTDNQSVIISAIPSGNYNYQLDNGALQESNIFENVSPGIHTISVIESNTCGYFLSEEILIINYPNYFTPNNDGINDFWYISGMNIFENWKISIFDRFGKLITQLNPSNIAWNGTFNSNELPSTDYWFLIEYQENGISRTFRSHFSLIR
uniref:T9SS type B sorting domain-containing protein n=1 Tax=Flavobacterium sp. TaxID=239 RepID=UPI00404ACBB5